MNSNLISKIRSGVPLALRVLGSLSKVLMIWGALPLIWMTACTMLLERWLSPSFAVMLLLLYGWAASTVLCWDGDYSQWRNAVVPNAMRWGANLVAALQLVAQGGYSARSIGAVIAIDLASFALGALLHRYQGPYRTRALTAALSLGAFGFWWAWGDAADPRGSAAVLFALVYTAGALLH